jgi:hypothetical protein
VESVTQLLPELYLLNIALLTNFPPDRFMVIYKGIMHSRVSFNSYNINAQVNNNLRTVIK